MRPAPVHPDPPESSLRVRAVLLSVVVGAAVTAVPVTAAATAAAPTVSPVVVAGNGPLDLYRATGAGFSAGHSVALSLQGDGEARPMGSVTVGGDGTVSTPSGNRIPLVAPGTKTLRMTQDDGLTADSPAFTIDAPAVTAPEIVQSASVDTVLQLTGLANTSDVERSVTVDGRAVPVRPRWYFDERTFADPNLHTYLPTLAVGTHEITFTQSVRTPFTATVTVRVVPATVTAPLDVATRQSVAFRASGAGHHDVLGVTVVGAAQDRHSYGTIRVFDDGDTDTVQLDGVSVGVATATFVSTQTGGTSTTTFTVLPSTVAAPAGLGPDGRLAGDDGQLRLQLQTDGNLVLRVNGSPTWSTRTAGHPGARLLVQDDGNVVIRGVDGRALWSTGTAGTGRGARLTVDQELGCVTLSTPGGRRLWANQPLVFLAGLSAGGYLPSRETLEGDIAAGPNGPFGSLYLSMQADGNLTLRSLPGIVWQTRTGGHPNAYAVLQTDGNLVVRGPDGRALWANGVRAGAGARLVLQPDGNVVERAADGRAVWSTRTTVQRY